MPSQVIAVGDRVRFKRHISGKRTTGGAPPGGAMGTVKQVTGSTIIVTVDNTGGSVYSVPRKTFWHYITVTNLAPYGVPATPSDPIGRLFGA